MQHAHLDCVLCRRDIGEYNPRDQQRSVERDYFRCHKFTPFDSELHLDLEADSELPEILLLSVESCVLVERHDARIELLDDVVKVHFGGFLVIAWGCPMGKLRLGIFPKDLEFTRTHYFRKDITSQSIGSLTFGIRRVVSAQ